MASTISTEYLYVTCLVSKVSYSQWGEKSFKL